MAAVAPEPPASDAGFTTRFLIWVAGIDEETLRECPAQDWSDVRAIALLLIFAWIYQAALLTLVAHRLLAPEGGVHPALIAGALFIATLILLIDSYVFLRAGFHADGIRELARAGLDLSGGWKTKVTAGIFLNLRISLSLALAQLTAMLVGLFLWQADIAADLNHRFQQENAGVIVTATAHVDDEERQTVDAVKGVQVRIGGLQTQIDAELHYLRSRAVWRNRERARQAQAALPELEQNLRQATSELTGLRETLARLRAGRADNIQREIEKSPAYVKQASGILAQLKALWRLAGDPVTGAFILLIDIISFGLELAAVLAKVTTFIPSTYAVLLARNSYLRVAAIVDDMEKRLNRRDRGEEDGVPAVPETGPQGRGGGGTSASAEGGPVQRTNVTLFPGVRRQGEAPEPGKRPRGRPRKDRSNGASPAAPGKDKSDADNDNEHQ